ncbi:MAG: hypothetical protein ACRC9Q_06905 [Bacteroidales bacterium]
MRSFIRQTIFFCLIVGMGYSCMSDPDFTTNPARVLSFSADTVRFDTLFTGVSSATRWLKVYNRNREPMRIADIRLQNGGGEFRINVDGQSGTEFSAVEIAGKDSLFIAVETTLQATGHPDPVRRSDAIVFSYNGNRQEVALEALAWEVVRWQGKVVNRQLTMTAEKPYLIYDSLYVAPEALLDIQAGARLYFHKNARLLVDGTVQARGTSGAPVTLRGDRLDELLEGLPYDRVAGQWEGIVFTERSADNLLSHCDIHATVRAISIQGGSATPQRRQLKLENCLIHNALTSGVVAENAVVELTGTQISNSGGHLVDLDGGSYEFVHCTLANFYPFGSVYGYALHLDAKTSPLEMEMRNSIVWGRGRNEFYLPVSSEFSSEVSFKHSVLKGKEESGDHFEGIVWNKDPLFRVVNDDYRFDFRLDSVSVARHLGRSPVLPAAETDFYGVVRDVEQPDAGAFEYK